ncbi:MAG: hypothetical protein WA117_20155 [Verrucomicrobiia bacterium]
MNPILRNLLLLAMIVLALIIAALAVAPSVKRRLVSAQCANYMASIGCVAFQWSHDHGGHFPSKFPSMSEMISTPKLLICPGDHSRKPAASWAAFTPGNTSYEIVSPGWQGNNTNTVFMRCKVHGHLGYTDATVFDGVRRRTKALW